MTLTFTDKEFIALVERIQADTAEDALDALCKYGRLPTEQMESFRKDIIRRGNSPYSYLLPYLNP